MILDSPEISIFAREISRFVLPISKEMILISAQGKPCRATDAAADRNPAGMDPLALKARYGQELGFHGGLNAVCYENPEDMWAENFRSRPPPTNRPNKSI